MTVDKKARTRMEQVQTPTASGEDREDDGEEDDDDDSEYSNSDSCSSDDDEEMEALQLLSEQIQEAKRTNQLLKKALVATLNVKKDKSSSELVASLFAERKPSATQAEGKQNDNDKKKKK